MGVVASRGLAFALVLAGAACETLPTAVEPAASSAGPTRHEILVATTRRLDSEPTLGFGGERVLAPSFARAVVSVPPLHKVGEVEAPATAPGDPKREFVTSDVAPFPDSAAFRRAVDQAIAGRPPGQRKILIFVHGYNTSFTAATHRITQIVHDARTGAVPLLFTWASRGRTLDYVYDTNSATAARDALEDTIRAALASKAEQVNILAHSMGTWVTVEALRQIRISAVKPDVAKLGAIILASPDIDVDVFKSQMRRFGVPSKPFFVVLSRDDRALRVSSIIGGGKKRLGEVEDTAELAAMGAIVIDMSDVKSGDSFNHNKFTALSGVGPGLIEVLRTGVGAEAEAPDDPIRTLVTLPLKIIRGPAGAPAP